VIGSIKFQKNPVVSLFRVDESLFMDFISRSVLCDEKPLQLRYYSFALQGFLAPLEMTTPVLY
jgi:hypothetical protein